MPPSPASGCRGRRGRPESHDDNTPPSAIAIAGRAPVVSFEWDTTPGPEYVFWREAGWVEDVVVRGNHIEDCGLSPDMWLPSSCTLGAISIFARKEKARAPIPSADDNRGITIQENAIDGCALADIWKRCASDLVVRGNRVSRANLHGADGAGADEGFDVRGVAGAKVETRGP